ncbi:helix-hairpin-helix domain-containing protein [Halorubrum rubrum]|uniref:Helix-hairpin-helix domain-containing protein n=1 Tax=Halorubrum rubrum TaxID=1126240 RepID=A0ABD5R144_9EURY|nr:helix-hairpin-helix domain-containing protein [Halorubrum rubrum]
MSELSATDHVHDLADRNAISTAIADRLDDNGFETVADLLIADVSDLEDVPYIGGKRAAAILEAVDAVEKPAPEPRDVDLEATESVVSEAAIPLSVRRGEKVLTSRTTSDSYHTTACRNVRKDSNLAERSWKYADTHDLEECEYCSGEWSPGIRGDTSVSAVTEPLEFDPVADVLDVGLGEKVAIVTEDGESWASPWCVVDVDETVSWTAPLGEDFETRTVTVRTSPQSGRQYDLLVTGDEVWMAGQYKGQPYQRLWRVEQVNPVGRIAQSSYYQLVGQQQEQEDAKPEGDDTWRQYQSLGEA